MAQELWLYKYLTSLHWALAQLGVGSCEIVPTNSLERFFAIAVLLCGSVLAGLFGPFKGL